MPPQATRAFQEGVEAFRRGQHHLVIEHMTEVIELEPDHVDAYLFIAQAYMHAEQYGESIQSIETALRLAPKNDLAHAVAGVVLGKYRENERAQQFFVHAMQLNPSRAVTYFWYARYWWENYHDREQAKKYLTESLKIDPTDWEPHLWLAKIYEGDGQLKLAEQEYNEAVLLGPDRFDALNSAGLYWLYRRHDPRESFDYFRRALKLQPNDQTLMRHFLIGFQAKHRWHYKFWNLNLFINRAGKWRWVLIIGLWVLIQALQYIGMLYPWTMPYVSPIVLTYVAFCIYTWTVNPVFKFLIRRGWIR